jgi:hypothetical protein
VVNLKGRRVVILAIRHVFFDVNETLTDFKFLQPSMSELGLSPADTSLWFAGVLRDGFALTLTEQTKNFAQPTAIITSLSELPSIIAKL